MFIIFIFSQFIQVISEHKEIKIFKNSQFGFYINASLDKNNFKIVPLKIELNSLITFLPCGYNYNNIISCLDELCYKLYYNEEICDNSLNNNCSFKSTINNQSISGIYINHYLNLQDYFSTLPVGCIEENEGIFGLGGDTFSFLLHFYRTNNFNQSNSFFSINLDKEEGGFIIFGKKLNQFHINEHSYINFDYSIKDSFYIFDIGNIIINNKLISDEKYEAIININKEYTYMNPNIIKKLVIYIKNYLTKDLLQIYKLDIIIKSNSKGICFINKNIVSDTQFNEKLFIIFPDLYINIRNKYYRWKSEHYLYEKNKNEYCLGFFPTQNDLDIIEFGANFMYGYDFIFNFSNKQIYIYESNYTDILKNKKDCQNVSKYVLINKIYRYVIIFLSFISIILIFIIYRLKRRRSFLCIKFIGKEVTNEDINFFINTNYNIIK